MRAVRTLRFAQPLHIGLINRFGRRRVGLQRFRFHARKILRGADILRALQTAGERAHLRSRDGSVVRSDPWVHLPGHAVSLSESEKALAEKLAPLIAAGRFNPPWVRDLASALKADEDQVRQVLRKQVTQGAVYQVVHDLFYDRKSLDELAVVITTMANEHGTVEAAQYRDAVGLGRKRAIQILEFFDRIGHTRRMRDSRMLRADSGWREPNA